MKIIYFSIVIIFIALQQSNAAVVRKQPAFSTPVYSNSYLPAAMQVIFHAVDQLKNLQNEEAEEVLLSSPTTTESLPTTSPHPPGQHQPESQELTSSSTQSEVLGNSQVSAESTASIGKSTVSVEASTASAEVSTASVGFSTPSAEVLTASVEISTASVEASTASVEASTASVEASTASMEASTAPVEASATSVLTYENNQGINKDKSEVIEKVTATIETETPEENYGTPETNHEIPEQVHEMAETNEEMAEKNGDEDNSSVGNEGVESGGLPSTVLPKEESAEDSSEEFIDENNDSSEESEEKSNDSKSLSSAESKQEESDSTEEEDDEIRFTLIGEKVAQVPRPSLSNYLRKTTKSPLRSSVQELAGLYDALSKDARKQGFAKFSGYSDEVLKTLETSAEGGIGPQLQSLLEKAVIRNELTREDTKIKLNSTLMKLGDPSTVLSRDLRRLIPLRYLP